MERQNKYRKLYKKSHPNWDDTQSIYVEKILGYTNPNTKILDVGCGHTSLLHQVYKITKHSYGIDPDKEAIEKNSSVRYKHVATAQKLPFEDGFFDLVVSSWILEHLSDPEAASKEIFRVLKPSGRVILLTPNKRNYVVWINRLIPDRFHDYLTQKLYGRQEDDTYPVRYRMNSPKQMRAILANTGFREELLLVNGDPTYISFGPISFWVAKVIERLLDLKILNSFRVHLLAIYTK